MISFKKNCKREMSVVLSLHLLAAENTANMKLKQCSLDQVGTINDKSIK